MWVLLNEHAPLTIIDKSTVHNVISYEYKNTSIINVLRMLKYRLTVINVTTKYCIYY